MTEVVVDKPRAETKELVKTAIGNMESLNRYEDEGQRILGNGRILSRLVLVVEVPQEQEHRDRTVITVDLTDEPLVDRVVSRESVKLEFIENINEVRDLDTDGIAGVEAPSHDPSGYETTVSDRWKYGVYCSYGLLWAVPVSHSWLEWVPGVVYIPLFLAAWILLPVAVYFDTRYLRANSSWDPDRVWIFAFLIPAINYVAGFLYLVRRYRVNSI